MKYSTMKEAAKQIEKKKMRWRNKIDSGGAKEGETNQVESRVLSVL